jgi:hypothetical protein
MLEKDFILGGNATFTVENGKGEHYTFKVRKPKPEMPYFVGLLTGPDNVSNFTYLCIVHPDTGTIKLTEKSKLTANSIPVRVAAFAFRCVWGTQPLPNGYKIRHDGKCGCCGRTLTTPESLDRGIGPECAKRFNR